MDKSDKDRYYCVMNKLGTHVVIFGASGLVGQALIARLLEVGTPRITALSRVPRADSRPQLTWKVLPSSPAQLTAILEGCSTVINLAGDNIGSGLWTKKKKRAIIASRVDFTRDLCRAIGQCRVKPAGYIQASALGFYGSGDEAKDETSPPGKGFLADLCQDWEEASQDLEPQGIRRIITRFGIVLSPKGGLLPRMAQPVRYGLGTVLGSGKQHLSWIHIDDLTLAMTRLLEATDARGAYNLCAPESVTQRHFMKTLAVILHRPLFWRVPAVLLHLLLGPMADELLLVSQRIRPRRLLERGFTFAHPELETALASLSLDERL
jgi:uncharacterized protein (TIGR01777 family)